MECRHLLAPAAAGLLLVAGARARADDAVGIRALQVTGGDFPALVMVVPDEQAGFGPNVLPGCDRIRARRLDELAPGWRTRIARIELECEDTVADDARDALSWAQANAVRLGARDGATAIGGVLTGANLATRLCIDLKRDFKPLPVAQLLVTPLVDLSDPRLKDSTTSAGWPFAGDALETLIGHYAGAGTDLTDPRISPALEKLIVGQPRTLAVSAGLDPLAVQTEVFVRRLIAARTKVVYRRYDTLPLGFDLLTGVADASYAAVQDIARLWIELLRAGQPDEAEAQQAEAVQATA